jgi:pyrroloquinoline quinone (PQQ) biosynthesis protein C
MHEFESHPFMQRWFAGDLRSADLQAFASEHYHVICALDRAARLAAAESDGLLAAELLRYADQCRESVGPWCEFAAATGWGAAWYFGEDPLPETVACADAIVGEEQSLERHLVTIHALESELAELAPRQLEALGHGYGFDEPATHYFGWRAELSAGAAAIAEAALAGLGAAPDPVHARQVRRSYLGLLDGIAELRLHRPVDVAVDVVG